MTNTYNAMYRTISRWLTSKRKKCHTLLQRKRNKDDSIPWCNHITNVSYIHPLIHGNLHVIILISIIYINFIHEYVTKNLYTMDISSDRFNSLYLSMPPRRCIYSSDCASSFNKWLRTKDHESSCNASTYSQ